MQKETFDKLLESVKKHEGYRNKVYLDTLNKRTVGVGHLCVEDFWEDGKAYEEKCSIVLSSDQNRSGLNLSRLKKVIKEYPLISFEKGIIKTYYDM